MLFMLCSLRETKKVLSIIVQKNINFSPFSSSFEAQCLSVQGRLNNRGLATLKSDSSRPLSAIIRLIHTE